jgi:hypothetical protein
VRSPSERVGRAQEALWRRFPTLRPAPPPRVPEQGRLILGRDKDGVPFPLSSRLLANHIDLVGGIGAGKSTAMRHLAWSQMELPLKFNRGTIIIDPHGSHEDSLLRTTQRRIVETKLYKQKRVFTIDPNSDWCAGLRLLDGTAESSVTADYMIEAFERMQNDDSFLEKPTLRRALHGLLAVLAELKWSLAEADLLLDPADRHGVREWALAHVTDRYAMRALLRLQYLSQDPRLYKEFEIETIGTDNRLAPLLSSAAMRAIVGSQLIDMRTVLDEGGVLLVNTAGGDRAYETAGDLLGKLVMRAILFAAKRRRTNSLALVFCDEVARYASQDFERALAELRKYGVGIVSAHQTFAMLGKPDDPVRQAIEKIPATKMALRMNSMEEAAALAPDLMRLNLELPVDVLTKPTVVGHERVWLDNESAGVSGTIGASVSGGTTRTHSTEVGESAASTKGSNYTKTYSSSVAHSESDTDEENWSETDTVGSNWSETDTVGESYSERCSEGEAWGATVGESRSTSASDSTSQSRGASQSRSGSTGRSDSKGVSAQSSRSYDRENLERLDGIGTAQPSGGTESTGTNASAGTNSARGWSNGTNRGEGRAHSEDRGRSTSSAASYQNNSARAETRGRSESHASTIGGSYSHAASRGGGHSHTVGVAETQGEADAYGTSEAHTLGTSRSNGSAHSVSANSGLQFSLGLSRTTGRTEALKPILKDMPGGVHNLENIRHMAAEMLCTLPDGVAVVRTVRDGRIEGAVVRVPHRRCAPVSDEQYAADLHALMRHSGVGNPMREALRQIEERERHILSEADALRLPPPEPECFRISAPGRASTRVRERRNRTREGDSDGQ